MHDPTMALTPEATIVYPELFEPKSFNNSDPKYSCTLLIDVSEDIKPLRDAIKMAAMKKWPGQSPDFYTKLALPIRNGASKAVDENGNPDSTNFYHGRFFLSAKSKWQPRIVNIYGEYISDPEEIYGGCVVQANLKFFAYEFMGKLGVSPGLQAICKISDGDPIGGGRVDPKQVFGAIIKDRDPADVLSKEFNETGQQGVGTSRIIGPGQDPWEEPPQEPEGGMIRQPGDEDPNDIPF